MGNCDWVLLIEIFRSRRELSGWPSPFTQGKVVQKGPMQGAEGASWESRFLVNSNHSLYPNLL